MLFDMGYNKHCSGRNLFITFGFLNSKGNVLNAKGNVFLLNIKGNRFLLILIINYVKVREIKKVK